MGMGMAMHTWTSPWEGWLACGGLGSKQGMDGEEEERLSLLQSVPDSKDLSCA